MTGRTLYRSFATLLFAFGLVVWLGACSGTDDADDDSCEPGTTRTCECSDDSSGQQTCGDDGSWGICEDCSSDDGSDDSDDGNDDSSDGSDDDSSDDGSDDSDDENQCAAIDESCSIDSDCCSGNCDGVACQSESACKPYGASCTFDSDCCSLECDILCE